MCCRPKVYNFKLKALKSPKQIRFTITWPYFKKVDYECKCDSLSLIPEAQLQMGEDVKGGGGTPPNDDYLRVKRQGCHKHLEMI